jgi:hypothetical protein
MALISFFNKRSSLVSRSINIPSFSRWIHSEVGVEREYESTSVDDGITMRYGIVVRDRYYLTMVGKNHYVGNRLTISNKTYII